MTKPGKGVSTAAWIVAGLSALLILGYALLAGLMFLQFQGALAAWQAAHWLLFLAWPAAVLAAIAIVISVLALRASSPGTTARRTARQALVLSAAVAAIAAAGVVVHQTVSVR